MKFRLFGAIVLAVAGSTLRGQILETDPAVVTVGQRILVYYNSNNEAGVLKNYTDDLYTHTGVLIEGKTGWQHVIGTWGINSTQPKLTYLGNYKYVLDITPDIEAFYSVNTGEVVNRLAFVFRDATATKQTADLFIDVYEPGLNVTFTSPTEPAVVLEVNGTLNIRASATQADSLVLFIDGQHVKTSDDPGALDYFLIANTYGGKWVKAVAYDLPETVADSFYYFVKQDPVVEALPFGVRDGINYTDAGSVTLVFHAPYKDDVFVLGDFNNWMPGEDGYMKVTPDGLRFWLEINELTPGQEYRYQYLVEGSLRIAEPYADKILDPANDQYITADTYPGLISYPFGHTTGLVSVLQTNQTPYVWSDQEFEPPEQTKLVIYELLLRDFLDAHNFATLIDTLWYIDSLGVNAIELMPVNEFEGNLSWGYNPSFYFAPDKYYGPKQQFKAFVDSCHARGIAVIMDMVLNHAYDQCSFVQLYFDGDNPTSDNPWFNVQHNFTNPDAQWGNDFNHESAATQTLVDSINSYWMSEYHINGFRFDFTKGFGNNIKDNTDPWGSNYDADRIALLKRMADEIWERNPNAYVILEHLAVNSEEQELAEYGMLMWGNMSHDYQEATMGYSSDLSGTSYQDRGWTIPHLVSYMESHDEERMMFKAREFGNNSGGYFITDFYVALERMELGTLFYLSIPGPKMIWQFGELAYDYSINYNPDDPNSECRLCSKPPRWDYFRDGKRNRVFLFYHYMNDLRRQHDVFHTSDFAYDLNDFQKRIHLNHTDMDVTILGNFGLETTSMSPFFQETGWWYEYFSGDSIEVANILDPITLDPGEYRLYTSKRLMAPDFTLDIKYPGMEEPEFDVVIYPNPSSGPFYLDIGMHQPDELMVQILDISGRIVHTFHHFSRAAGRTVLTWDGHAASGKPATAGFYFVHFKSSKTDRTFKILKQ